MLESILKIEGLSHWFGENKVLYNINLDIKRGQIVGIVGPSGCGKSTLLRAILGTHLPSQGKIIVYDGETSKVIDGPGRDRGIVYQRYSLFPHLTAQENVAYGLMVDQTSIPGRTFKYLAWRGLRKKHMQQAAEMLEKMKLGAAFKKFPPEMSGGMCQRVALAQALIMKPTVLLLDEPFGALDEATREEMQKILLILYGENSDAIKAGKQPPYTMFLVTHEINEAIYVGDRVVGLSQYWNWKESGHASCPGATIVYDKASPVFATKNERNFLLFREQKEEIICTVFNPESCCSYKEYTTVVDRTKIIGG